MTSTTTERPPVPTETPKPDPRTWRHRLRRAVRDLLYPVLIDDQDPDGEDFPVHRKAAQPVLMLFADLCNPDGSMTQGTKLSYICEQTALSESHARRVVRYLCAAGFLALVERGGGRLSNLYSVNVDLIHASARPVPPKRRPVLSRPSTRPSSWTGTPAVVNTQGGHRDTPPSVNSAHKSSSSGSSFLAVGTPAREPRFDCGHGYDVRCKPLRGGRPSCAQCRDGEPPSSSLRREARVSGAASEPPVRAQPSRGSRRDRRSPTRR